MAIRSIDKNTHVVQVQRGGARKTKRIKGTLAEAKKAESLLIAEMDHEQQLDGAAALLGLDRAGAAEAAKPMQTFRQFFEERWVPHAKAIQNATTRSKQESTFRYLLFYVGDKPLTELLRAAEINDYIERIREGGPLSFTIRKDGEPYARRSKELKAETINKSLQCLKAVLNLAHSEQVIAVQPKIQMLPPEDSVPVLPPTEEQLVHLLTVCEDFERVAPHIRQLVEFASETGLRRGELFNLPWRSVDLPRAAIRVEVQQKSRMVNGRVWKPKHGKFREVPLSSKARAILQERLKAGPFREEDLVFPNRGGAPFERVEGAPEGAGKGYFQDVIEAAGLRGKVTFHSLRHLFAVRLLTRGVPMPVVSDLLGHSEIQITVKRYGRFSAESRVRWDAVRVLDT